METNNAHSQNPTQCRFQGCPNPVLSQDYSGNPLCAAHWDITLPRIECVLCQQTSGRCDCLQYAASLGLDYQGFLVLNWNYNPLQACQGPCSLQNCLCLEEFADNFGGHQYGWPEFEQLVDQLETLRRQETAGQTFGCADAYIAFLEQNGLQPAATQGEDYRLVSFRKPAKASLPWTHACEVYYSDNCLQTIDPAVSCVITYREDSDGYVACTNCYEAWLEDNPRPRLILPERSTAATG